jgi:hypothetical protein
MVIEWLSESSLAVEQLTHMAGSHSRPALEEAVSAIYSFLGGGSMLASEVKRLAVMAGITDRTLRRTKDLLGVRSVRSGFGRDSRFSWALPPQSEIFRRLFDRDLDELLEELIHGDKRPQQPPTSEPHPPNFEPNDRSPDTLDSGEIGSPT